MNSQTKLVFALEHVAHLHDLIEDNEWEHYLNDALCTLEFELERQLALELSKKTGQLGTCLLYTSPSPRDLSTSRMPSSA